MIPWIERPRGFFYSTKYLEYTSCILRDSQEWKQRGGEMCFNLQKSNSEPHQWWRGWIHLMWKRRDRTIGWNIFIRGSWACLFCNRRICEDSGRLLYGGEYSSQGIKTRRKASWRHSKRRNAKTTSLENFLYICLKLY